MAELVDETVKCPKELNDVRKAIVGIVEDVKAGKDLVLVAGENLQALSAAIDGIDKVPGEISDNLSESVACIGIMAGEIVSILAAPKVVPVADA